MWKKCEKQPSKWRKKVKRKNWQAKKREVCEENEERRKRKERKREKNKKENQERRAVTFVVIVKP